MTQLTPHEEDPVIHGLLANLEQFSPSRGFSDRVMRHVFQPAPSWVQQVAHVCRAAFSRKRVWTVVGGLAATSAVAMVAITIAAISYWVHIETVWSVLIGATFEVWRFAVQSSAALAVVAMRWMEPFVLDQSALIALICSTVVVLALSGIGLRHTIRLYRNERIALHARR